MDQGRNWAVKRQELETHRIRDLPDILKQGTTAEQTLGRECSHADTACMNKEDERDTPSGRSTRRWMRDMERQKATVVLPDSHATLGGVPSLCTVSHFPNQSPGV